MPKKKLNIAVVGLGFGAEFIPIWQRHPETVCYAICQRDPKKLKNIGDAFGVDVRYTDFFLYGGLAIGSDASAA